MKNLQNVRPKDEAIDSIVSAMKIIYRFVNSIRNPNTGKSFGLKE